MNQVLIGFKHFRSKEYIEKEHSTKDAYNEKK